MSSICISLDPAGHFYAFISQIICIFKDSNVWKQTDMFMPTET